MLVVLFGSYYLYPMSKQQLISMDAVATFRYALLSKLVFAQYSN